MEKQIFTIGYTIPTFDENYVDFYDGASLMDADILLISPDSLTPRGSYGSWIEFSSGGGCYNAPTSSEYEKKISHLKKEVTDFLQSGKSVFIILSKEENHLLSSGASHPRKGENLHSTYTKTNYDFLPISMGTLVSASGKNITFSGNPVFSDFYDKFKKSLEYHLYLELLGYKAENYNDGILELDHIITSPDGDRFIGEAEGKDTSAINIDKFRQLAVNIQEDLQRDEVENSATGILFGNGFRLTKPSERAEQFTTKCINTAKSSNCVLVRTTDLFNVAKYAKESKDENFAKSCRDAIKNSVGKIVDFPTVPKNS